MLDVQNSSITPLMRQYFAIKSQHENSLLFFQVGDFYELFFDDAKQAAAFLGITLTSRGKYQGKAIPLCGVPVHTVDFYITKLIRGGFRIAICDQLEPAVPGKVVARGITKILTPGTLTDSQMLDEKSSSFLFSFFPTAEAWGLVFAELLTAQLFATHIPAAHYKILEAELSRFFPDEIIIPSEKSALAFNSYFSKLGYCTTTSDLIDENEDYNQWLKQVHNEEQSVLHMGAINASFKLLYGFLKKHQEQSLTQFNSCIYYKPEEFLMLDASTQHNLEIIKNMHDGGRKNTLFELMDKSVTPMGSRMIKKWLVRPLLNKDLITQRQDMVESLLHKFTFIQSIKSLLARIGDFERIVGRIALRRACLQDYINLSKVLELLPNFVALFKEHQSDTNHFASLIVNLPHFSSLALLLQTSLSDDSSPAYIKTGFDRSLDTMRALIENSTQILLQMERQEQERTGINSLKINYNNVHGYFIEITKANLHLVPDHYIRHQTLVGKERFTTLELKKLEAEILQSRQEIEELEKKLFEFIKEEVYRYVPELRKVAHSLSTLDALVGFAHVAYEYGYVRPQFNENQEIIIKEGKHPVIAGNQGYQFIANDTHLTKDAYLWLITGPNMGGKSTYLRQVALICLMAQCGSFVPAHGASLPILDRIFTRIGAGDNVAQGKSTFLVEMEEVSLICSSATQRSLIILDEVGRGTSTSDGLAIAWSIIEYLYMHIKALCLFATHYHELTVLEKQYPGIKNYHTASKQTEQGILLLHKILPGVAQGSFGIEVAKLAALPATVINRAQEILQLVLSPSSHFEKMADRGSQIEYSKITTSEVSNNNIENQQLKHHIQKLESIVQTQARVANHLKSIEVDNLSARQALDLVWSLKDMLKESM